MSFHRAGFKRARRDAKLLAAMHRDFRKFYDEQKENSDVWNDEKWVKDFKGLCDDFSKIIVRSQEDVLYGLRMVNYYVWKAEKASEKSQNQILQKYFHEKRKVLFEMVNEFKDLLKDARRRESTKRRDRFKAKESIDGNFFTFHLMSFFRSALHLQRSERRKEKIEKHEGKDLKKEYKDLISDLKDLVDYLNGKKTEFKKWKEIREHLYFNHEVIQEEDENFNPDRDESLIYHTKHFFKYTVVLVFELKNKLKNLNKPDLFNETIERLESLEQREEKRMVKKAEHKMAV